MAVNVRPSVPLRAPPPLQLIAAQRRRRAFRLHLFTYVVGNAFFWALWGAIAVSADRWYWWPVVPVAGWAGVLLIHVCLAYRRTDS